MKGKLLELLEARIAQQGVEVAKKENAGAMYVQAVGKAKDAKRKNKIITAEDVVSPLDNDHEYLALMADIGLDRKEILKIAQNAIDSVSKLEVFKSAPKKQRCPVCRRNCKRQSMTDDAVIYHCPTHGDFTIKL